MFVSHPGYFGKVGMRYFHKTKQQFHCPTINTDKIWSLVSDQLRTKYKSADPAKDPVPVIDVGRHVSRFNYVNNNCIIDSIHPFVSCCVASLLIVTPFCFSALFDNVFRVSSRFSVTVLSPSSP